MKQAFGFQRGQRFIPTAKAGGFRAVFCGKVLCYGRIPALIICEDRKFVY